MPSLWSTVFISAFIAPASLASEQRNVPELSKQTAMDALNPNPPHLTHPIRGLATITCITDFNGYKQATPNGDWIVLKNKVDDKPGYLSIQAKNAKTGFSEDIGQFQDVRILGEDTLIALDGNSATLMEFSETQGKFIKNDVPYLPDIWAHYWTELGELKIHWISHFGDGDSAVLHTTLDPKINQVSSVFASIAPGKKISLKGPFVIREDETTVQFTDVRTGQVSAPITIGHPIGCILRSPDENHAIVRVDKSDHPLILVDTHTQHDRMGLLVGSENTRKAQWVSNDLLSFEKQKHHYLRSVDDPSKDVNDEEPRGLGNKQWQIGSELTIHDLMKVSKRSTPFLKLGWIVNAPILARLNWT